ncbi:MAG: DUF86 domain-containing protein [Dehalococcoidia bacterium]|nr:DUF86 domain-containing protein [Dehalococcoidia bacterium]
MTRRDPMVYVFHMMDYSRDAVDIAQDYSRADLDTNRMLRYALIKAVETIGEAASRVPEDYRTQYPEIPWRETRDLRNRLVHEYDRIDLDTLWNIIQDHIPPLIEQLEDLISQEAPRQDWSPP